MTLFPVLCLGVLTVFLGCLGLFALAVTKVVAPDGRGHARGLAGGFAALLAVLLLCGLGVVGLGATVVAIGLGSVSHWNPIRRIEIQREAGGPTRPGAKASAVSARLTVRGDAGSELTELLQEAFDVDPSGLEHGLTVQERRGADGSPFSVYEFRLPISEDDLERFERDVDVELDGLRLRLPERIDIQFEGAGGGDDEGAPEQR